MSAFDAENRGVAAVGRFRSLLLELLDEASAAKRTTTVEPAVNKADIKDLQLRLSSALATEGGAINGKPIFGDAAAKQDDAKAAADTAKETGQQVDIAKAESFKEEADALKAAADAVKLRQFAIIETATRDLFDELIVRADPDTATVQPSKLTLVSSRQPLLSTLPPSSRCGTCLILSLSFQMTGNANQHYCFGWWKSSWIARLLTDAAQSSTTWSLGAIGSQQKNSSRRSLSSCGAVMNFSAGYHARKIRRSVGEFLFLCFRVSLLATEAL